ncbi:MAG TPA: O-antigen ligase family protein [Vicinamibacterales bacterium]|nr:O-antigen ligase family protein [Vicinamibacterales bacterium]
MSAAAAGVLLLIPVAAVVASPIVPIPLRLLVAAIWPLSLIAPAGGLAALAVVAPFGAGLLALSGAAPVQYTESLVLATLSGLLLAAAWKPRDADAPVPPSIARPMVVFSAIVLSSLAVAFSVSQVGLASHRLFFAALGRFVARDYLISGPEPWPAVGAAAHLVEGGLLLALVVYWLRGDRPGSAQVILATAAAATVAAAANLVALGPALRGAGSIGALAGRLLASRISVHVADVNAAGSYFAMASVITVALYDSGHPSIARRRVWALVTAMLFAALWLTGSRTALVCVAALIGVAVVAARTTWRQRPLWPVVAGAILMLAAAALVVSFDPRGVAGRSLERTVESRAAFLTTGVRMIASAPAFGVGIGRYVEESGRFMPQSIYWYFFRENAHNNFLQVGGELGLIGLAAFVWLMAAAAVRLVRGVRAGAQDRLLRGAAGGLAAFVATWLTGHPLLTPEVAFPFWMLAGAAIARADGRVSGNAAPPIDTDASRRRRAIALVGAAIVLLAASVPLRAARATATMNVLESSFGFYEWEQWPGRSRTRWASPSAAFFVPAETREVVIPVRTMFFDRHPQPVQVRIAIDGRVFERFALTNDAWKDVRLQLPAASRPAQPRRIDIVTEPSWSLAQVFGTPSARAFGVQLSEITTR